MSPPTTDHRMTRARDAQAARVELVAQRIGSQSRLVPRLAIVLGSGLGEFASQVERAELLPYASIDEWPKATAIGHAGNLVLGHFAGVPVAILQGRLHLYEGHSRDDVELPVRVLDRLGVRGWFISNAAGGLHPQFRRGELMGISGHLDLTGRVGGTPEGAASSGLGWQRTNSPYDSHWLEQLAQAARSLDITLHSGCYAMMSGPSYETRAEYRALRRMGADAVGMSTLPETRCAASLGHRVLALSVITNEAKPDAAKRNDAEDVLDASRHAAKAVGKLLEAWIRFATEGPPS